MAERDSKSQVRFPDQDLIAPSTRRAVLIGLSVAMFAASCSRQAGAPEGVASSEPPADPAFVRLSALLTGHADLDPLTGARLAAAFATLAPDVHAAFPTLGKLARPDMSPQDVLAAVDQSDLKSAALAIVAAWYTGTAGTGTKAITVSYRDALMQRPVADALAPSTYALGGPGWWTAPPPEVGLSRSTAQASTPATTGSPEPKSK